MNRFTKNLVLLFVLACAMTVSAFAADVAGTWTSTFTTQMGEQHYTYTFVVDGEKLTGKAKNDMGETDIKNGVIKGDDISFDEVLDFGGQTVTINYTGKIAGDEIKFTRKVGDFATEDLVANRQK